MDALWTALQLKPKLSGALLSHDIFEPQLWGLMKPACQPPTTRKLAGCCGGNPGL